MSMKSYSDKNLIQHTRQLVATERKIAAQVLEALEEIERRRLYLARGYSSLFAFCTEELGYSSSSAQRRISSMRLLKQMPEAEKVAVVDRIRDGELNLTHLSLVSQATHGAVGAADLLAQVAGTTTKECEKILACEVGFEIKRDRIRPTGVDRVEIVASVDVETSEMLKRFKDLTAAKNPKGDLGVALKLALEIALAKVDTAKVVAKAAEKKPTAATAVTGRYVSKAIRARVWVRDQGKCQYNYLKTGRQCGSKFRIEIDHVHPFALGGETTEENLRLLCANHNRELGRVLQSKFF